METKKGLGCFAMGCGGLIVAIIGFAVVIFAVVMSIVKSSDVYAMAMERAESNPAIVEAIGKPIEAGFFVTGGINTNGPAGDANIAVPLSGPKGEGTLYVVAQKSAGVWKFSDLTFEGPTGSRTNLLEQSIAAE